MKVVGKIRDFSRKYHDLSNQRSVTNVDWKSLTEQERQKRWYEEVQKSLKIYSDRDSEFHGSILPDVLYARQELLKRKIAEPVLPQIQKSDVDMILKTGALAGAFPEVSLVSVLKQARSRINTGFRGCFENS
jgi:hypothetical protein